MTGDSGEYTTLNFVRSLGSFLEEVLVLMKGDVPPVRSCRE